MINSPRITIKDLYDPAMPNSKQQTDNSWHCSSFLNFCSWLHAARASLVVQNLLFLKVYWQSRPFQGPLIIGHLIFSLTYQPTRIIATLFSALYVQLLITSRFIFSFDQERLSPSLVPK